MSWLDQLQPASFRGIPFVVLTDDADNGRRTAVHEYPFRDDPYAEDLGRSARGIEITGFLIGDDVIAQRQAMIAACEQPGGGQLVHPSLGRIIVSLRAPMRSTMRWDKGRYVELRFVFVQTGTLLYPTIIINTGDVVGTAADNADAASNADFVAATASALKQGSAVIQTAVGAAAIWARLAQNLANDSTNLNHMVSSLSGRFGRYFNGANNGGFNGKTAAVAASSATINSLIVQGAAARSAVGLAVSTLGHVTGSLGQ